MNRSCFHPPPLSPLPIEGRGGPFVDCRGRVGRLICRETGVSVRGRLSSCVEIHSTLLQQSVVQVFPSACTLGFATHVETRSPPVWLVSV